MADLPFESQTTIEHIVSRWADRDRRSLVKLFPLLAQGRPVPTDSLPSAVGIEPGMTEPFLSQARCDRDDDGNVVELFGVSLSPSGHRVLVGDVVLFSCCAAVAHMVPMLLGEAGRIESLDPTCNRLVAIEASSTALLSAKPAGAVASFVRTTQEGILSDVRSAFCTHVRHFTSREGAESFCARDPRRYVLSIEQLHAIALELNRRIWS